MHAITVPEPGGPEQLVWTEVPDPVPGEGEVLIEVVASAVNRADIVQRLGHYKPPPGVPAWPGLECSGRIVGLGDGVEGWTIGDPVCALLAGGGYAELVTVPVGQVLPVPMGVELVIAAGLPEVTCTVWSNVFMVGGLRPSETVLIHGGASGIGTMAIQLAHQTGARVVCTAGSAVKLGRCRELGADVLINYNDEDFVEVLARERLAADVVLDNMGAEYLARNVEVLARNGRLVVIGLQGGRQAELDISVLWAKCGAVIATSLRRRPLAEKAAIVQSVREHVWPLLESGQVHPVVDRVMPITAAADAHRVVEGGEHVGKVLLQVR